MLSPCQEHLLSQKGCCLEVGGHENRHSVPDYLGNMLSPVRNAVILRCCDAGGWVTGKESESSATTIPKSLLLGTDLIWSNLTWSILTSSILTGETWGKMGQLNKNKCVCIVNTVYSWDNGFNSGCTGWDFSEHGKLGEFCTTSGKIVTKYF